jgi:hypothetical protein
MTKFEQIGINIQLDSISKEDALKRFTRSCLLCCHKGMRINCDHCAIATTHRQLLAIFADKEATHHD